MFKYMDTVILNDNFYVQVVTQVLDKRLYANEVQYLVALNPPRWLPERKLQRLSTDEEQI
jgi:hypothetical protein